MNALSKFGVYASNLVYKNINVFDDKLFNYVITLCDSTNNEYRSYTDTSKQLAWDIPDPKERSDSAPFFVTLTELNNRLSMFLLVEQNALNCVSTSQKKVIT